MSLSNKLKEIIDEIINEEEIEEASTTANVPGYQTPYAFTGDDEESKKKKEKNATASTGYKMVKEIYNQNYRTFKKDESKNSRQKVNGAIKEINKRLFEIERIIGRAAKLKREAGVSTDNYWKPTRPRLKKIPERLIKVSNKLTEIAS